MHTSHLDVTKERVRESPSPGRPWWNRLIRQRSVRFTVLGWLVANLLVLVTANGIVPFEWSSVADRSVLGHLLDANLALLQVLLLMGVVFALTRKRNPVEVAARSPERVVARRETLLLLGYGILALIAGLCCRECSAGIPSGSTSPAPSSAPTTTSNLPRHLPGRPTT